MVEAPSVPVQWSTNYGRKLKMGSQTPYYRVTDLRDQEFMTYVQSYVQKWQCGVEGDTGSVEIDYAETVRGSGSAGDAFFGSAQ